MATGLGNVDRAVVQEPDRQPWRVALLGAGPAAQAIHLPTIAGLAGRLRVTEIMDVDAGLAAAVASPLGARATSSLAELMAGDGFDIAVIGSPNQFHAEQIMAVCAAGVRGILAEKPLAVSMAEARQIAAAVAASGAALVVGAMHTYDPAWLAVRDTLADGAAAERHHVRSAIYLPDNPHFEDMATTMVRPPAAPRPPAPEAEKLRGGILGLAIHDLPLIRRFVPVIDRVASAATLEPWGYAISASGPAGSVELLARTGGTWRPDWTLSVWGPAAELHLSFPPSYVHAGSATATVVTPTATTVIGPDRTDGYQAEWEELLAVLDGAAPRYPVESALADLEYALALADLAVPALACGQACTLLSGKTLAVDGQGTPVEPVETTRGRAESSHPLRDVVSTGSTTEQDKVCVTAGSPREAR